MKICAVIAEYNPFHLGHAIQLDYIKRELSAQRIVVIMSGNFTQRGEPAILDKFTRARHAILAGADAVIELPAIFSVGNAETFAKGAINILNSLGCIDGLCFGIESGNKEEYLSLASAMNNETKEFKKILKEKLSLGISLAKAKFETLKELGANFDEKLIGSPNNILALEYTKAILALKSNIEIFPLIREGNHNDENLKKGATSATSIRNAVKEGKVKKVKNSVPKFVYADLHSAPFDFDKIILSSAIRAKIENIKLVPDCTEGLENRIKALCKDNNTVSSLVDKATTKRYTSSRIRRILIGNMLGISQDLVNDCLKEKLYAKVLAVNADAKDLISYFSEKSSIPLITRKSDIEKVKKTAEKCLSVDILAHDLFNLVTNDNKNENYTLFV